MGHGEGVQYMPATREHQHVANLTITLLNLLPSAQRELATTSNHPLREGAVFVR
jgi:hypothetical protein